MKKDKYILIILAILVYFRFLTTKINVANDFPYIFPELLKSGLNIPFIWTARGAEGMGSYAASIMWFWPIEFLYGIGANIGLGFSFLEKILGFFPIFILGFVGISKLSRYFGVKGWGIVIGAFIYLVNTYILLLIDGGQLQIGLAYAWIPTVVFLILTSLDKGFKNKILAGLAVSLLGFFDIRFVYVLVVLLLLRFIYQFIFLSFSEWKNWLISWFKLAIAVGIVSIGLNAYWLLPVALAKAAALPETYTRGIQALSLSFANLGHSLFLLQPHWYKNVFGKITPLLPQFVLIPILVFLAPILRRKNKEVGFWLIVALVSVFLVKGANPPLSSVYQWLFTHVPGFSLFRDPTKFFFLVALSYSVLIGVTVDELTKRFNWSLSIGHLSLKVIPLLLAFYFLVLISPVWLGKMTGIFSNPIYQNEFFNLADGLGKDKEFGRVFWIPAKAPLGYSSPTHPTVEASRLVQKRPFAIGTVGMYETFNFLREAPFMGELFKIAGIKYISYPYPDARREDLKQDNIDYYYAFLDQLSRLPWIKNELSQPPVPVLETKESNDHFFLSPNTFLIVGSDRICWDLMSVPNFDLAKNALIFAEENPGIMNNISNVPYKYILLYDKSETDLAASFIDKSAFYFPANYLDFSPSTSSGSSSWWKRESIDIIWWRNFLQEKYKIDNLDFDYGGGWAVAEGQKELLISNDEFLKGNVLLARVMKSSRGGKVSFYQGDKLIGEINTKIENPQKVQIKLTGYKNIPDQISEYDKADFNWFEVGQLAMSNEQITIRTEGDINVVNALASLSEEEWNHLNRSVGTYKIIDWSKLSSKDKENLFRSNDSATLSYQYVSPAHYKVRISGLKDEETLSFSETYDSLWQANGKSSYPLYSLINGFRVDGDGEYDIYFSAQKYVLPGLIISGVTLILIAGVLILLRRRNTSIGV